MNVLLVGALLVILSEVIILLANLISLHPPRSARRRQSLVAVADLTPPTSELMINYRRIAVTQAVTTLTSAGWRWSAFNSPKPT